MACPPLPHRMMSLFKIEYSTFGKAGSEYIKIEDRTLSYVKNQQDTITRKLRKKHYSQLHELFKEISLDSLETLKIPTKRHQADAALAATLLVTDINSKEYLSPTFDDDNPPQKIKALITYIKELANK